MDLFREADPDSYTATDMPKYPARTLIAHCAMKGLQVGSVLGLVVTPIYSYFRKQPISTAYLRIVPMGTSFGLLLLGGMTGFLSYQGKLDVGGVDDRAYRISKNVKQTKVDQFSFIGAVMCTSFGVIVSRGSLPIALAHGCSGVALGMLSYVLDENVQLGEMIKELKEGRDSK